MTTIISGRAINEAKAADEAKTSKKGKLPVVEIFGPTIQGEGAMLGVQTMFIRLGGCDFRCTKCDSLHAVLPQEVQKNSVYMTELEVLDALQAAKPAPAQWITISGGNPAMHDLTDLVGELHQAGFKIAVETQGSIWRDWMLQCDHVTISPKGPGMGEEFSATDFNTYFEQMSRMDGGGQIIFGDWSVKVVVMNNVDIEFVVGLLETWPSIRKRMYLSLGNPYPPQVSEDGKGMSAEEIRPKLLKEYTSTVEEILQDQRLRGCKVTPQLHVLFWGNQQGK